MSSASSPPPLPSPGRPSPVCDLHGDASAGSSEEGEDEDNLRRFMRTFGYKQDDFYDAGHGYESDSCFDGESSASDDIAYLRRLQEQFLAPAAALDIPGNPPILKPIRAFPPLDTDDEEDFETLRAIQRRFAHYGGETHEEFSPETNTTFSADSSEQDPHNIPLTIMMNEEHQEQSYIRFIESGDDANNLSVFPKFVKNFIDTPKALLDNTPKPSDTCSRKRTTDEEYPEENQSNFNQEYGLHSLSVRQFISSKFPKSVQNFVYALKKNRSCQRFIREKLIEIEAKIEVNRKLKERIKCLMDFHTAYKRKVGHRLCQKRDPRVRLISFQKQKSSTIKENSKKNSALYFAPAENSQMSNYKMVMRRFPVSLRKRQWSNTDKEKLLNGVNQQCLEMLFLNSMNLGSDFDGLNDSIIMSTFDCARHQVTPENLRSFIRLVNWDRLASMYLPRRSGPSCESRWLNHEDPMINCDPWTSMEDKKLLLIVQERGLYNWIDIASTLGTNRTPFQCLARYQRSLNPHILNREWTSEEDAKLCTAVETFGDKSWQIVASHLDDRTSNQCSVRWRNTLLPERKRVGRWSVDEDKRLKVAVILFGAKNWKKIAQFIPGRTQSQSRERWLNCLDPSLNLERWSEEEDGKILAAIAEHGHSWSKVAACIPGRTDNQCRRRWKVLLPHEVPMLKVAQQLKRTVLISNFVGREGERPAIGPNDFTPVLSFPAPDIENYAGVGKKRSRISQTKRFKFHKRERIEDIFASSELSEDALMALPLVHVMKLISRKSRAMHEALKKNINEEGMLTYGQVFPADMCTSETEPSTTVINIKRTLRISQTKRFKFHKRERIEDIFASSELSEDALMALPLVHVLKLISRKSRAMHETLKKNINEEGMLTSGQVFPADICTSETEPSTTVINIKRTLSKDAKAMCSKKSRISKANYANESNLSDDMNGIGNISNIENNMEHLVSVFPEHDQLVDNLTLPEREQTVVNNTECTATATKGMPSKGVCFDPGTGKDEHLQTAIGAGLDTTSSQVEMNRNHDTVD